MSQPLAAQLSAISQDYQHALAAARRNHPSVSLTGASGIRRDRAEAKARREYKARLAKVAPYTAYRSR